MVDLQAIRQLAEAYPILVDSHDLNALIGLFADDAVFLRAGAAYSGRRELREFFGQIMSTYSLTAHSVHQHLLDLRPGARTALGIQMGHGEVAIDGQRMVAAYRYDDEYCRVDDRWLFQRRHMRYEYYTSHEELALSLEGRQRVRVPGAAPRDAEIPEELPSYQSRTLRRV
ncbi:nuclear transport factor 2 family protein [Micrococcaceae bacterium Sec5.1]